MGFSIGVRHRVQDMAAAWLANPTQFDLFCLGRLSTSSCRPPNVWEPGPVVFPAQQEALQSS